MKQDVTGLILAGGSSQRFGSDKALHLLDGKPLIEHVFDAISCVVDTVLVSVGSTKRPYPIQAQSLLDSWPDGGPLAGLHAGLQTAPTPWLLVVACDMPFVQPEVLHQLLDARVDEVNAVVAQTPDGLHPACACYHQDVVPVIETLHRANRLALHDLVGAVASRFVDVEAAYLRNINKRSDI